MFLKEHCPELVEALSNGLALVTTRCSCEYFDELRAFDEVILRMRLGELVQNRVTMLFDYVRAASDTVIARGEQQIACMERRGEGMVPVPVPEALRQALAPFAA
jgi:enediyne biosynthesis thioesterase